jgi:phosphate transport system regulatory protein PhoU
MKRELIDTIDAGGNQVAEPVTLHLEALLQRDTDAIRAKLLEMGALDEQALSRALAAFSARDRQLAYSVILRDQEIDTMETELDQLCLEFIVRHQPAAAHLRFVYSASKVVGELERVGDYAERIARQVLLISETPFDVPLDKFHEMSNLAIPMLHNAVRAFVDKNPDLARATMASEPRVNHLRDSLSADLVDWRAEGRLPLEALTPLIFVARRLERVSDQATNICEHALYFATGQHFRHLPREGFHVLFLDESNGCLSRIAESIGRQMNPKRFTFSSAGVSAGPVDPFTIHFLSDKGVDIPLPPSRPIDKVPNLEQVQVIIVLGKGLETSLPQKPTKTLNIQWLVPDPSQARGEDHAVRAEYEHVYGTLTNHIRDLIHAILGDDQNAPLRQTMSQVNASFLKSAACVFLAALASISLGCSRSGDAKKKLIIQNTGSDTMVNLAQAWAEEYAAVQPAVSVEVSGGGSGTGIAALLSGTVDIANCSRTVEPSEVAQAKKNTGKEPREHMVGYDALAVYVNKDNPLEQITLEQLAEIY